MADVLIKDRASLASSDAWRSLFIVLVTFSLIWFYIQKKLSATVLVIVLGLTTLIDLWSLDKRYLNNEIFVDKTLYQNPIQERKSDQLILLDKSLSYRVLDLTTNPFSDTKASYFHKSLGGYHAAKLMRFQELLEYQFNGTINEHILDMFNVKYIIKQYPNTETDTLQLRSTAVGNAWFVDKVVLVENDLHEMQAITNFNPAKEAFVNNEFKSNINLTRLGQPNNAKIKLVSYLPDKLKYEYTSTNDVFAVFSEVYYNKGWKAYIDGKETPIIPTDYLLRGMQLPSGNHKVEFIFDPVVMRISKIVSIIGSAVLLLGLTTVILFKQRKKKVIRNT